MEARAPAARPVLTNARLDKWAMVVPPMGRILPRTMAFALPSRDYADCYMDVMVPQRDAGKPLNSTEPATMVATHISLHYAALRSG